MASEKEQKTTEKKTSEKLVLTEEVPAAPPVKDNKPALTASRFFVEKLKKEEANKGVSPSVFVAFAFVAPRADTEENYRKLWKKTFKRD